MVIETGKQQVIDEVVKDSAETSLFVVYRDHYCGPYPTEEVANQYIQSCGLWTDAGRNPSDLKEKREIICRVCSREGLPQVKGSDRIKQPFFSYHQNSSKIPEMVIDHHITVNLPGSCLPDVRKTDWQ